MICSSLYASSHISLPLCVQTCAAVFLSGHVSSSVIYLMRRIMQLPLCVIFHSIIKYSKFLSFNNCTSQYNQKQWSVILVKFNQKYATRFVYNVFRYFLLWHQTYFAEFFFELQYIPFLPWFGFNFYWAQPLLCIMPRSQQLAAADTAIPLKGRVHLLDDLSSSYLIALGPLSGWCLLQEALPQCMLPAEGQNLRSSCAPKTSLCHPVSKPVGIPQGWHISITFPLSPATP